MEAPFIWVCRGCLILATIVITSVAGMATEPKGQILSPQNGARISQNENTVLLSGKVSSDAARTANVDVIFNIDVFLSTAHYAGVNFPDRVQPTGVLSDLVARAPDFLYSKETQISDRAANRYGLT